MDLKEGWEEYRRILEQNGITDLYHFTDQSNLPSIVRHGGLYSWHYCETQGIPIPCPGGDESSKDLDTRYCLQDYVKLSFNRNHPMLAVARTRRGGTVKDPVILRIDPIVAYWRDTLFSDMNATDGKARRGGDLEALKAIHFSIAKASTWAGEMEKKWRQAEVMVRRHVPLKWLTIPP